MLWILTPGVAVCRLNTGLQREKHCWKDRADTPTSRNEMTERLYFWQTLCEHHNINYLPWGVALATIRHVGLDVIVLFTLSLVLTAVKALLANDYLKS